MKLRALQNAQINGPHGLVFVEGPVITDDEKVLAEGQVIDVPDDFEVNPDVFVVVEALPLVPGQEQQYRPIPKGDPRLKGVRFAKPSRTGTAG